MAHQPIISFLKTLSQNFKNASQFVENLADLINRLEGLEEKFQAPMPEKEDKADPQPQVVNPEKGSVKHDSETLNNHVRFNPESSKELNFSQSDKVVNVIKKYPAGVKNSIISQESGLSGQALRTAIYLAKKAGKIKRLGNATYIISTGSEKIQKRKSKNFGTVHEVIVKANGGAKVIRKTKKAVSHKDHILSLVKNSEKGVNIIALQNVTGFSRGKIAMVLMRGVKNGVIRKIARGTYAGI